MNINNLKIPNLEANKVISTNEEGKIIASDVNISSIENATQFKTYNVDTTKYKDLYYGRYVEITAEKYPDLYNQLTDIFNDFKNNIPLNIILHIYTDSSITCVCTKQLAIEQGSETLLHLRDVTQYSMIASQNLQYFKYSTYQCSINYADGTITRITLGTNGSGIPSEDSYLAEKQYVDQQIASIQSQINTLETTVDDILGQQAET